MRIRIYNIYIILIFSMVFSSCGKFNKFASVDKKASECIETDLVESDSMQMISIDRNDFPDIKIEFPEIKLFTFPDEQSALTFMEESEESERYKNGILPSLVHENLDYASRLLNNYHDYFIVVDKSRMKVILFSKYGETVKEYGMACAKNFGTKHKRRDSRTPEGFFEVKGIYDSTEWLFTDDDGNTSDKKGQFGPRFIRLNIPGTSQIGIHGTCAPWSIGHRSSHGCIRLTNENILELVEYAEKKMPVIVIPGRKDAEVNAEEGYKIPWFSTSPNAKSPYSRPLPPKKEIIEEEEVKQNVDSVAETQHEQAKELSE